MMLMIMMTITINIPRLTQLITFTFIFFFWKSSHIYRCSTKSCDCYIECVCKIVSSVCFFLCVCLSSVFSYLCETISILYCSFTVLSLNIFYHPHLLSSSIWCFLIFFLSVFLKVDSFSFLCLFYYILNFFFFCL